MNLNLLFIEDTSSPFLLGGKVTITLSVLQRCPLGTTVLKIKKLDMGEPKALLATALSPPSVRDIERTILQLKEVGVLLMLLKLR